MTGNEKCGGQWRSAGALLALLLGISLVGGRSAAAQAPALRLVPPAVLTGGEINCAADFGAPPNQFMDDAGKMQGVNVDVMTQITKEIGINLKWTNLPFGSQIAGLQGGRFDAMCGSSARNTAGQRCGVSAKSCITDTSGCAFQYPIKVYDVSEKNGEPTVRA